MRIFIAGHKGMVGAALVRQCENIGHEIITRTSSQLDLRNQLQVSSFMKAERPDAVILAAAKVGGIYANNKYPAEFIYDNLSIQTNVIEQAHRADVNRLLLLGSSCIYPKLAKQPMSESALLTGKLEPTNEPYAIAKIAGIKMCESYNRQYQRDYRSVMPTNLYGPGDNFHPENSHVLPALMVRLSEAARKNVGEVGVWGTGRARREFLFVEDMAEACLYVLNSSKEDYHAATTDMQRHINVGTGKDITIAELVSILTKVVGYSGEICFDTTKPDGAPRKLLDVSKLTCMGWSARTTLQDGIEKTYEWYIENEHNLRGK